MLSIVIPVYNEESILEREIIALINKLSSESRLQPVEILIVENGSIDQTPHIVDHLSKAYPSIKALHLSDPSYGRSLRTGILDSKGDNIFLCNIDFWDLPFLQKAIQILDANKSIDIVVGSKTMIGASDQRSFVRSSVTKVFNKILRIILGYDGTDTHGMKVLRGVVAREIAGKCTTDREIFDTELLIRAQRQGATIQEIPVKCIEIRNSTYGILRRIPRTLKDLGTLIWKLR